MQERSSQDGAQTLLIEVAYELPVHSDGDRATLFGDDDRHGVGYFADPKGGAVTGAEALSIGNLVR